MLLEFDIETPLGFNLDGSIFFDQAGTVGYIDRVVSDSGQVPHENPKGFVHQMDLANEISAVRENLMSIIINKMTIHGVYPSSFPQIQYRSGHIFLSPQIKLLNCIII